MILAGIRVATASDSVAKKRWIIVDWAGIPNFSGDATHTFEVWIETATLEIKTDRSQHSTTEFPLLLLGEAPTLERTIPQLASL